MVSEEKTIKVRELKLFAMTKSIASVKALPISSDAKRQWSLSFKIKGNPDKWTLVNSKNEVRAFIDANRLFLFLDEIDMKKIEMNL